MTDGSRPAAELEAETRARETPHAAEQLSAGRIGEPCQAQGSHQPTTTAISCGTASGAIPSGRTCIASAIHRTD